MLPFLAQADDLELNFWRLAPGPTTIWIILGLFVVGMAIMFAMLQMPTRLRRPIQAATIFLAGLFWVLVFLLPRPIDAQLPKDERPQGVIQGLSYWLADAIPVVTSFSNVITAFLLGLGVFSLVRIHLTRVIKKQNDWPFSVILLVSIVFMAAWSYTAWLFGLGENKLAYEEQWPLPYYMRDLLFDGMLQVMEAAMFSLIAFFILSAAYRAFRIRSVEATILLTAALIAMLSLMGGVVVAWDNLVNPNELKEGIQSNLTLSAISGFIRDNLQTPGIRAIDFGIGLGALAMGLRLWLSLERAGAN